MNTVQEPETPFGPGETINKTQTLLEWVTTLAAVLFNTAFSVLAIVTLCGIVFVTKPQDVMHDIPPDGWLPLLILMAPAQIYAQFLS